MAKKRLKRANLEQVYDVYYEQEYLDERGKFEYRIPIPNFEPKTKSQKEYAKTISNSLLTICTGKAGTGKSFVSIAKSLQFLLSPDTPYTKLVVFNPAVEVGMSLGFLPGNVHQKLDVYTEPTKANIIKVMSTIPDYEKHLKYLYDRSIIEFKALNYTRGSTYENAIIILEEAQNVTEQQMKTFLTRLGNNVKCIVSGDIDQIDLRGNVSSGLKQIVELLPGVKDVDIYEFGPEDVIRSELVKNILIRYEENMDIKKLEKKLGSAVRVSETCEPITSTVNVNEEINTKDSISLMSRIKTLLRRIKIL